MFEILIAKASRPVLGKDEDRVFIFELGSSGSFLLGVADGISMGHGRAAARWIEEAMSAIANENGNEILDARVLYEHFRRRLSELAGTASAVDSHSTLSCGIGRISQSSSSSYLRFEFFGIGDSPIWRVMPRYAGGIAFQVSPVYSPPIPSELGKVYSSVNLRLGQVEGPVHFGSVDIESGELLIVASDGLPEARVLFDDQDPDRRRNSPMLIENLMRCESFDDNLLAAALAAYDAERLLIDDDASLAVARWRFLEGSGSTVIKGSKSNNSELNVVQCGSMMAGQTDLADGTEAEYAAVNGISQTSDLPNFEEGTPDVMRQDDIKHRSAFERVDEYADLEVESAVTTEPVNQSPKVAGRKPVKNLTRGKRLTRRKRSAVHKTPS